MLGALLIASWLCKVVNKEYEEKRVYFPGIENCMH